MRFYKEIKNEMRENFLARITDSIDNKLYIAEVENECAMDDDSRN